MFVENQEKLRLLLLNKSSHTRCVVGSFQLRLVSEAFPHTI